MLRYCKILPHELGLYFRDEQFVGILSPGRHWLFDFWKRLDVDVVSARQVRLDHPDLDELVRSEDLKSHAMTLSLTDRQRALVWVDGRFDSLLGPGSHVLWTSIRKVKVEVVETGKGQFEHENLDLITRNTGSAEWLDICDVQRDHAGVYFRDGRYVKTFESGRYAFWKKIANSRVVEVDMREKMVDVSGQDVMTADHVTLRLNAVVAYVVENASRMVSASINLDQSLYREAQLVFRDVIGAMGLDDLLTSKEAVAVEAQGRLQSRASELGLKIVSVGIRDVILPGDMKELLNQVTAARKAAEANLISRREETAAIRSQANTAKLLDANPTLMRLRELEVLEKVANNSSLQVMLGDSKGLSDRVMKLI